MVLPISKTGKTLAQKSNETEKPPRRSFQSVMMQQGQPTPRPTMKKSVFDFPKQEKKQKTASDHVQHGETGRIDAHMTVSGEGADVSSVAELSPAMQDLLSQMEHYVTLESHNGISTVELMVDLEDPFGQLQGTIIRIEHYDTHPHSFNVLLLNPNASALDELTAHLPSLLKDLQSKLEHFQINLLPPAYPKLEKSKSTDPASRVFKGEKKEKQKTQRIERAR